MDQSAPPTNSPRTTRRSEVDALAERCAREMARYSRNGANEPAPCLALFRLAVARRDPCAWEGLLAVYTPHVERWIRREATRASAGEVSELVENSIARFWRCYTCSHLERAHSLGEILRYWQACAHSEFIGWLRASQAGARRETPIDLVLPEPGDRSMPLPAGLAQDEARALLWRTVQEQCHDDADLRIAHGIFVEGLRPAAVYAAYPALFADKNEIFKRLRNLKDRLRRVPQLADLLAVFN